VDARITAGEEDETKRRLLAHPSVKEYLRKVDKARGLLLICMLVTGGQPARGPDLLSLRYKDSLSQD
jgi:hypothetical protein